MRENVRDCAVGWIRISKEAKITVRKVVSVGRVKRAEGFSTYFQKLGPA